MSAIDANTRARQGLESAHLLSEYSPLYCMGILASCQGARCIQFFRINVGPSGLRLGSIKI